MLEILVVVARVETDLQKGFLYSKLLRHSLYSMLHSTLVVPPRKAARLVAAKNTVAIEIPDLG